MAGLVEDAGGGERIGLDAVVGVQLVGRTFLVRPSLSITADCSVCDLGNPQCDSVGRGLQRIVGEMRIPSSCVHMIMAQQFSDHRKPFSNQQSTTGIRVA